jgi:hypothetical protein
MRPPPRHWYRYMLGLLGCVVRPDSTAHRGCEARLVRHGHLQHDIEGRCYAKNEMEFSRAGVSYPAQLGESKDEEEPGRHATFAHSGREGEVARGFTVLLACATR